MKVVFRCDGDRRRGAGHVARSLQVAQAFVRAGHEPVLVGSYSGLAATLVEASGVAVRSPAGTADSWGADAVLVDSYDAETMEAVARCGVPAMGFWDHGARPQLPSLVRYHPGATLGDPGDAELFLGPAYAPVSPEFVAARRPRALATGLVAVGGSDAGAALAEEAEAALEFLGVTDTAVAGAGGVREVGLLGRAVWADVAVCAAGGTAYELACAGVPAVAVAVAANQMPVVEGLAEAGTAIGVDAVGRPVDSQVREAVARLADAGTRARLATAGPALVDGFGAARLRNALIARVSGERRPRVLTYRPATVADAEALLRWRNDPEVRAVSRTSETIAPHVHAAWLENVVEDPDRALWMVESPSEPVGSIRFDRSGQVAEISVAIGPAQRGRGVGAQALTEATELYLAAHADVRAVEAHVVPGNEASLKAFERAGYRDGAGERRAMTVLERGRD